MIFFFFYNIELNNNKKAVASNSAAAFCFDMYLHLALAKMLVLEFTI